MVQSKISDQKNEEIARVYNEPNLIVAFKWFKDFKMALLWLTFFLNSVRRRKESVVI